MSTDSSIPLTDLHKAHQLYLKAQPCADAIERLGTFLVEKIKSYPDFLEQLCVEHNDVSYDKLKVCLAVGQKQMDKRVAANLAHVNIRKIMYFPYEVQKRVLDVGVDVIRGDSEVRMSIYDMNCKQMVQVFMVNKKVIRTPAEQREYLLHPKPARLAPAGKGQATYTIDPKAKKVFVAPNKSIWTKEVIEIAAKILTLEQAIQLLNAVQARESK